MKKAKNIAPCNINVNFIYKKNYEVKLEELSRPKASTKASKLL